MIECKYNYTLEDNLKGTKFAIYNKKSKKDKITFALIYIAFALLVALFIYDIVKGNNFVFDIILIIAFILVFLFELFMPKYVLSSQKKYFEKSRLNEVDYCLVKIDKTQVIESFLKGEKEMGRNVHSFKDLTRIEEDEERFYMLFGRSFMVVLRKEALQEGDLNEIKSICYNSLENKTKKKK